MKQKLMLCLLTLLCPGIASAAIVYMSPASAAFVQGSSFGVDIYIGGVVDGSAPSVGVFDISVAYTPSILSFASVEWGSGLDVLGLGSLRTVTASTGEVSLFELSFDSVDDLNFLQVDTFLLFKLIFVGPHLGTSPVSITVNSLGDAEGFELSASVVNGSVIIGAASSVPEPGPCSLIACGIVFLVSIRRRRVFSSRRS